MDRSRDDTTQPIREIVEAVELQIARARELRETSHNHIQENAELRQLLRENLLTSRAKREHWEDT